MRISVDKRGVIRGEILEGGQDRKCAYCVRLRSVLATFVAVEKAISIIYSECAFVALSVQGAARMRHIVVCGLRASILFFHISHKRHNLRMCIYNEHKMRVFLIYVKPFSETFLILSRTERDIIKYVFWFSYKVPVILAIYISINIVFIH